MQFFVNFIAPIPLLDHVRWCTPLKGDTEGWVRMNKLFTLLSFSFVAVSSQATIVFSSFGPGDSAKNNSWGFGDLHDARIASQFTSSAAGSLDVIKLSLRTSTGTKIGKISLYEDSGNDIGALLGSFEVDLTTTGVKTIKNSNPSIMLLAGSKYWLEASSAIGSGVYSGWNINDQNMNGLIKFGAVNGTSQNPTSTYKVGNGALTAFSVQVVPEPSTLIVMGSMMGLGIIRRRKAN